MRSRKRITIALLLAVLSGLASRSGYEQIPDWLATNAGDALWTSCVYLSLALVRPNMAPKRILLLALVISLTVELSQLWGAAWLEELRRTVVGSLLLGRGWQWADLPRYGVGATLAWAFDRAGLLSQPSGTGE